MFGVSGLGFIGFIGFIEFWVKGFRVLGLGFGFGVLGSYPT